MNLHQPCTDAEKISVHEVFGNFSRRSDKKLMATHLKVGSVCNSPFQNSLQEKRTAKILFSFLQLC